MCTQIQQRPLRLVIKANAYRLQSTYNKCVHTQSTSVHRHGNQRGIMDVNRAKKRKEGRYLVNVRTPDRAVQMYSNIPDGTGAGASVLGGGSCSGRVAPPRTYTTGNNNIESFQVPMPYNLVVFICCSSQGKLFYLLVSD